MSTPAVATVLPADRPRVVLTDLEGTTTALHFVQQVLFPFARARLPGFVAAHAGLPEVRAALAAAAPSTDPVQELLRWIDLDRKHPALKALQGRIWQQGYEQQQLQGHLWPDAVQGLQRFRAQGLQVAVYSSGSVQAQQLLFRHSVAGNLEALVDRWFDTGVGSKQDPASYVAIAAALAVPAGQVLFLSDVPAELDAARQAGMATCCLERGEQGLPPPHAHPAVASFDDLSPAG